MVTAPTFLRLAATYKQLNGSFGAFAMAALDVSTRALSSNDDATYTELEGNVADWTAQRDDLAGQIKSVVDGATFHGQALNKQQAKALTAQAQALIDELVAAAS